MLPLSTTTVSIERQSGATDPYEAATTATGPTGIPAHIGAPGGSANEVGGDAVRIDAVLHVPHGTELHRSDIVVDEITERRWRVQWHQERIGLGLDHVQAGLSFAEGAAA